MYRGDEAIMKYTYESPYSAAQCMRFLCYYPCTFENGLCFFNRTFPYECTVHSDTQMTIVFSGSDYGGMGINVHYLFTFYEHSQGTRIVAEFRKQLMFGSPVIGTYHLDRLMKQKVDGVRVTQPHAQP